MPSSRASHTARPIRRPCLEATLAIARKSARRSLSNATRCRKMFGLAPVSWTPGLSGQCFVFPLLLERSGTEIAKRRMPSPPVVEGLEVIEELTARRGPRAPGRVVDELDLQRGEEALSDGVVPAVAPPAHAADDPVLRQHPLVVAAGVLTAPIRMMQQAPRGTTASQRHPEGVEGEVVRDALAHRPADGEARAEIEDHRQVEPALARRDVRDVGDPRLIRLCPLELPRQDVGRDGERVSRVGRHPELPAAPGGEPADPHQARHALATRPAAAVHQFGVNPRAAIPLPALRVDHRDLEAQSFVRLPARGRRPGLPRVETRARHLQRAAEQPDWKGGLLRRDEREPHAFSFAKKAVAFFRMSRSIRNVRFSRRSCPSSSRSAVVSAPGVPRPASISACRTQLRSAISVRSSSRATVGTDLLLSRTSRTASALNSFVNARRLRLAVTHSYRTFVRSGVSTKPGQVQSLAKGPCAAAAESAVLVPRRSDRPPDTP